MLEKIKAPSTETTFANASEHGSRLGLYQLPGLKAVNVWNICLFPQPPKMNQAAAEMNRCYSQVSGFQIHIWEVLLEEEFVKLWIN